MSDGALSEGAGVCSCERTVSLSVSRDALRMGAGPAAMRAALLEVHRVNRRRSDRVAISLPGHDGSLGFAGMGTEIRAFGSEDALRDLVSNLSAGLAGKMLDITDTETVDASPGDEGAVFYRSRLGEKSSEAGKARAKARIERRGGIWVDRPHRGKREKGLGFFECGAVRIFFGSRPGKFTGSVTVNTYGLAPSSSDEALPVKLENAV